MLAAAYNLRNNLWFPIGIHWAWNFTLGTVFGANVSGEIQEYSIFASEIKGPIILTGGDNGLEGSIVTCICGILVGIYFVYHRKRNGKHE